MEELIKIGKSVVTGKPVVDAKDLYNGLGITKDYTTWLVAKLNKLNLVKNRDYTLIFFD